jgi:hypothetical protein
LISLTFGRVAARAVLAKLASGNKKEHSLHGLENCN